MSLLSNFKPLSSLLSAVISGIHATLLHPILLQFFIQWLGPTHQNQLPHHQIFRIILPPSPPPVSRPSFITSPDITSSRWSLTAKGFLLFVRMTINYESLPVGITTCGSVRWQHRNWKKRLISKLQNLKFLVWLLVGSNSKSIPTLSTRLHF